MKISTPLFIGYHPILSLVTAITILTLFFTLCCYFQANDYFPFPINSALHFGSDFRAGSQATEHNSIPVSLIGVHHLGSDHIIDRFYVNQGIGDNIGEGGGGGSMVCCITLPRQWRPKLVAEVRWQVDHIIKSNDPAEADTAEIEGIYRALVPVERYEEAEDFYVHFFPNGRVRIVVSPISATGKNHPIPCGVIQADDASTAGLVVKSLFTDEELAKFKREADLERKKYGDWR